MPGAIKKSPLNTRHDAGDIAALDGAIEPLRLRRVGEGFNNLLKKLWKKAAIVGVDGELEHAAAILHPKLGAPLREAVGEGKAIVPSAKKMGGPGKEIDVPVHYKDAAFVRSHFDAMSVRVPDAPRSDKILVAVVITASGRPKNWWFEEG